MISNILHLILPMFFYTAITTFIYLNLNLPPLETTALSAILVSPILYYFYSADQNHRGHPPLTRFKLHGSLIYILIFGASLCIFGNYMVDAFRLTERSVSYKEAENNLYSASYPLQILASGILIPFTEEIIFRGLGFAALREKLPFWLSAALSAALFGLYHGNLPQGVYAFLIGLPLPGCMRFQGPCWPPIYFTYQPIYYRSAS